MAQLFNKGNETDSEAWDDRDLIELYNRSISAAYGKVSKKEVKVEEKTNKWRVNDTCLAPYVDDDEKLWYRATITQLLPQRNAAEVCFDVYENVEMVPLDELYPDEGGEMNVQTAPPSLLPTPSTPRGKGGKGPSVQMPRVAPPPPPAFSALAPPSHNEALSSMLMSWYMSGYHTGYYQALQDMNKKDKGN